MPLKIERNPTPERSTLLTPLRIAGATSRIRRRFARASGRADAVLGERSAAWDILRRRIDELAEATALSPTTANNGVHVSRLMLELTPAGIRAARVQTLAAAMLALAQAIEAEDIAASVIAADLAGIASDADLVVTAIAYNRGAFRRHDVKEIDESFETPNDGEDFESAAA